MAQPAGLRRPLLLLVDDEQDILMALATYVEAAAPGVEVVCVTSAPDALEILRKRRPSLIVTDYRMPGMTGMDLLAEAGRLQPDVPCILMTAYPDMDLAVRALNENRIKAFLPKPLAPATIKSMVDEFLC